MKTDRVGERNLGHGDAEIGSRSDGGSDGGRKTRARRGIDGVLRRENGDLGSSGLGRKVAEDAWTPFGRG